MGGKKGVFPHGRTNLLSEEKRAVKTWENAGGPENGGWESVSSH